MDKEILEMHKLHLSNLMKERGLTDVDSVDDFITKYTFDAVSMEGNNKISIENVERLIKFGDIDGFQQKDKLEVINHAKSYELVKKLALQKSDLQEDQVKDLHDLLLKDIIIGGIYRNVNIQIIGASHQPPDHVKVYDRMKKLFSGEKTQGLDDFQKAIYVHGKIAKIHPFLDGNGRLSRLVLNYYLIKAGYIAISIEADLKQEYFKVLDEYKETKNTESLTNFIIKQLNKRYEELIHKLEV